MQKSLEVRLIGTYGKNWHPMPLICYWSPPFFLSLSLPSLSPLTRCAAPWPVHHAVSWPKFTLHIRCDAAWHQRQRARLPQPHPPHQVVWNLNFLDFIKWSNFLLFQYENIIFSWVKIFGFPNQQQQKKTIGKQTYLLLHINAAA